MEIACSAVCGDVLLLCGSANRASLGASAAANTYIGIDFVLAVTLCNRLGRASLYASAAGYAIIRNFVCHWYGTSCEIFGQSGAIAMRSHHTDRVQ